MANIKPIALKQGKIAKETIKSRIAAEEALKGNSITDAAPKRLSKNGKGIYKHLVSNLPQGFLTETDSYTLEIVANAIDLMQQAQEDIRSRGMYIDGDENPSHRIYERYCKIFNTQAGKLGLSPRDRAALSVLLVNQKEEDSDPLLNLLKGNE